MVVAGRRSAGEESGGEREGHEPRFALCWPWWRAGGAHAKQHALRPVITSGTSESVVLAKVSFCETLGPNEWSKA